MHEIGRNGRKKKNEDGNYIYGKRTLDKGRVRDSFLNKYKIGESSELIDWFFAFLEPQLTSKWCTYSNMKALLCNAGNVGQEYSNFKPFTLEEVQNFLGLYMLNGLVPSPRLEFKFKSQIEDPISGNDLCHSVFGNNAERRLKEFKKFLSLTDPRVLPPPKKANPNFKLEEFFDYMKKKSKESWQPGIITFTFILFMLTSSLLGPNGSVDEQTIGFQGKHVDKLKIKFKRAGDGFMCDAWCDAGFTYTFYFRNEPAPKKYLRLKLSALHARCLSLFDDLPDSNYRCWVDNLHASINFLVHALKHKSKVMIEGVARKSGRGVPECVKQEEVGPSMLKEVVGTCKAAKLSLPSVLGETKIVAASIYDSKPVYFLSSSCESIKWVKKEKKAWNTKTESFQKLEFLRLSMADSCNNGMGNVDLADQKRLVYRFDSNIRNTKWWWSIWFWGVGVQMVNSYVAYCSFMKEAKAKHILSHCEFRKQIAISLLGDKNIIKRPRTAIADVCIEHETDSVSTLSDPILTRGLAKKSKKQNKASYVTDESFLPKGNLSHRMNAGLFHNLMAPSKSAKCAIHRWATNRKIVRMKHVFYCPDCNVNVCINCHHLLRMEPKLLEQNKDICQRMVLDTDGI